MNRQHCDSGANTIQAFSTNGCGRATVFVGEPNDNSNPLLGTLNLSKGQITPFVNHFVSPKGLLFVTSDQSGNLQQGDNWQIDPSQFEGLSSVKELNSLNVAQCSCLLKGPTS